MHTPHTPHTPPADRATILRLAAAAEIDPRTAARVLAHGPDALHALAARARARRALIALGLLAEGGDAHA